LRRAASLIGITLTLVGVCSGASRTDRDRDGLKGPVGVVRIEVARFSNSAGKAVEGSRVRRERRTYDEQGNLYHEALYDGDYVISSRFYFYESSDIQSVVAYIRKGSEVVSTGFAAADRQGMNTLRFRLNHKNDAAGNRIGTAMTAEDGTPVRKLAYSYDKLGDLTEVAQYSGDGKLLHKWVYNATNDIKQHDEFSEAGTLMYRESYSYEYDGQKNWIKRVSSRQVSRTGRPEPFEVAYRTIAYYAPLGEFQTSGGLIPAFVISGGAPRQSASAASAVDSITTRRTEPLYPVAARAARISGVVDVEVTVDEEGDVLSARAVSGHPLLKEAALDAAWDWKFTPTKLRGRAIKFIGLISFRFNS
jgi:TonB family protein